MCFYFGKNAFSALRPLWMLKDLCGNKWSYAFFVRSFGYALFYFIERRNANEKDNLHALGTCDVPDPVCLRWWQ